LGYTIVSSLGSDLATGSYIGASQLSLSINPGVWICSYVARLFSSSTATVYSFNAYIQLPNPITNVTVSVNSYSALTFNPGTVTIGTSGLNNLSLTGSSVITTTTTQNITLLLGISVLSGATFYNAGQTYIMATRIG